MDILIQNLDEADGVDADSLFNMQRLVGGVWKNYRVPYADLGPAQFRKTVNITDLYHGDSVELLPAIVGFYYLVFNATITYTPGDDHPFDTYGNLNPILKGQSPDDQVNAQLTNATLGSSAFSGPMGMQGTAAFYLQQINLAFIEGIIAGNGTLTVTLEYLSLTI